MTVLSLMVAVRFVSVYRVLNVWVQNLPRVCFTAKHSLSWPVSAEASLLCAMFGLYFLSKGMQDHTNRCVEQALWCNCAPQKILGSASLAGDRQELGADWVNRELLHDRPNAA